MEKIKVHDKYFKPMISNEEILAGVDRVAEKINLDYKNEENPPILLCILNGALPFTAALMQRLDFDHELVSMKVSSYVGTHTTGSVQNLMGPTASVKDRRVIICEDIVDTGITIRALRKILVEEMGAIDVRVATLLVKPGKLRDQLVKEGLVGAEATEKDIDKFMPEYNAITIPNDFIVGFGLDYDELGRNYKDIYVLSE